MTALANVLANSRTGNDLHAALQGLAADVDAASRGVLFADQFASIQAAVDALPSVGGMVVLSSNTTYTIGIGITSSKPNVHIWAPSWNTILKRTDTLADYLVNLSGAGCCIEGMTFDGNGTVNISALGEVGVSGVNSIIRNVQVINWAGQIAIELAGANSTACYNTVTGLGTSPSTQRGYGIWAVNHVQVTINNNAISGTGIDGIGFDGDQSLVYANNLTNCHCYTGSGGGAIVYYASAGHIPNGVVIALNAIKTGGATCDGIEVVGDNVLVALNTVNGVGGFGIIVENSAEIGRVLLGNLIMNVGTGGTIDAISIQANVGNVQIIGNRAIDNQATHTSREALRFEAGTGDNILAVGNVLTPFGQAALVDNATGLNKVIANNLGVDNVIGTLASAATLSLANTDLPLISLTGSVGVTVMAGNAWKGRSVDFLPTGAVVFTAGATIANTVTTVANVPVIGTFDGTKWWLK